MEKLEFSNAFERNESFCHYETYNDKITFKAKICDSAIKQVEEWIEEDIY